MALRPEFTIAWDGEPTMSGQPERQSAGTFATFEVAEQALSVLPSAVRHPERNYRIEGRLVTEWVLAADGSVPDARTAIASVLVQLDHTDDYVRAFGATLDELEGWERESALSAADEILAALRIS